MAAPVYLYTGPEAGERNDQVIAIKESLKKKYGSSDDFTYYGNDLNMSDVVTQLMTESLFTPATSVVIRNAEAVKDKKDIDMLSEWVKSAENKDSTVLILVSDELKVDAKLEKIVPPSNKKIFWEMFEDKKEQWVINYFKKNGYGIEPEAVSSILEMIENNTEQLRNECSRFFMCFPAGYKVTNSDVEQILSHNREESAFTMFDAILESLPPAKRLENSLSILQKILLSKKDNSPVVIIAGLVSCFRRLSMWQTIHSQGHIPSDIELKSNGFSSKTAQKQYAKAAKLWSPGHVAAILALLAKTDLEIRSTGSLFQENQLTLMLYEIIVKNGAYCARYETD